MGIGAAGTVIADMLFFGEPFTIMKVVLLLLLLVGIIGLKLSTDDSPKEECNMSWLYLLIAGLLEWRHMVKPICTLKTKILYCFNGNYVYF